MDKMRSFLMALLVSAPAAVPAEVARMYAYLVGLGHDATTSYPMTVARRDVPVPYADENGNAGVDVKYDGEVQLRLSDFNPPLRPGVYAVHVRAETNTGVVNNTEPPALLYVFEALSKVTAVEWFAGEDPGEGNGTPIPTPADGAWDSTAELFSFSIPIGNLPAGTRELFVRSRHSNGYWGPAVQVPYRVMSALNVSTVEVAIGSPADATPGPAAVSVTPVADDGAFNEPREAFTALVDRSTLTPGQDYRFFVRASRGGSAGVPYGPWAYTDWKNVTPTPTATPTPSPSATPSPSPSQSPSFTATMSATPSLTPTATPSLTASATPSSSLTASATPSPSPTASPSQTASLTASPSPSVPPSLSPSPSRTASPTASPSATSPPSLSPSATPSSSPSRTPSPTASPTPSPSFTASPTPSPTLVGENISAPRGLRAIGGASTVRLSWQGNRETYLRGYDIYRQELGPGDVPVGSEERITDSPINLTQFTDTTVPKVQVRYRYTVAALNSRGEEGPRSAPAIDNIGGVRLDVRGAVPETGRTYVVQVIMENADNVQSNGIRLAFQYPRARLTFRGVERTAITESTTFVVDPASDLNQLLINGTAPLGATDLSGEGHIVNLLFDVIPSALDQQVTVELLSASLSQTNGQPFDVAIGPPFATTVRGTGAAFLRGDVTGDGTVTSADADVALSFALDGEPTAEQIRAGDLNGDGRLNSFDATMLQRLARGLPVNPDVAGAKATSATNVNQSYQVRVGPKGVRCQGGRYFVEVVLNNPARVAAVETGVTYDPLELRYEGVQFAPGLETFKRNLRQEPGAILVAMSAEEAATASGSLAVMELEFSVVNPTKRSYLFGCPKAEIGNEYGGNQNWTSDVNRSGVRFPAICPDAVASGILLQRAVSLNAFDANGDGSLDVADTIFRGGAYP